jgi:hypothetical protein
LASPGARATSRKKNGSALRGSISGNRDHGVLIEGTNTAFNTVNSQFIGVVDPYAGIQVLKFSGNGRSGIAVRDGAHNNIIGDQNTEIVNVIFACPAAGIELSGAARTTTSFPEIRSARISPASCSPKVTRIDRAMGSGFTMDLAATSSGCPARP